MLVTCLKAYVFANVLSIDKPGLDLWKGGGMCVYIHTHTFLYIYIHIYTCIHFEGDACVSVALTAAVGNLLVAASSCGRIGDCSFMAVEELFPENNAIAVWERCLIKHFETLSRSKEIEQVLLACFRKFWTFADVAAFFRQVFTSMANSWKEFVIDQPCRAICSLEDGHGRDGVYWVVL